VVAEKLLIQEGKTRPSGPERALGEEVLSEPIELPKNSALGFVISGCAFAFGFGMIWHVWWLAALGLVAAILCLIYRSFEEETEHTIHI
jgi:cytochrome o ubiquinol oxidase subunit 1